MIPLKLQLKNFLSYGSEIQTVDFSSYPLICLSGKNGHGKSALLDAMTWALWGQARKIAAASKADQGLLRLGQTQMMVSLDFEFNGQVYRVRREFAQTYGKPYAALDFGILNQEKNTLLPLSDKTIRETQAKIERTLNLDFESFSNSAFLRQGQANEFSTKSPKDRKEILATILGLNKYETIRKLAMEKARQASAEKTQLLALQEKYTLELSKTEDITKQLAEITTKLTNFELEEINLQNQKNTLENEQKQLNEKQKEKQLLTYKIEQLYKEEKQHQEKVRSTLKQWRSVHKKHLRLPNHDALEEEKKKLTEELNKLQAQLQKALQIKEAYLKQKEMAQIIEHKLKEKQATELHQKKITLERLLFKQETHEKYIVEFQKRLDDLHAEKKQITKELTTLIQQRKVDEKAQEKFLVFEKQFERRKEFYQKFIAQGNWIKKELDSIEQKKQLSHDEEDPSCPLCEQNLSAARKRFLKNKFIQQEQFLSHRLKRIAKVIQHLKLLLFDQHKEIENFKKTFETQAILVSKIVDYEKVSQKIEIALIETQKQKIELEQSQKDLPQIIDTERKNISTLEKQNLHTIIDDPEYKKILEVLNELELEAKKITYRTDDHNKTSLKLANIEQQLTEYKEIKEQYTLQTERKKVIEETCALLKSIKKQKISLEKQIVLFQNLIKQEHDLEQREKALQILCKSRAKEKEETLQKKGNFEAQCEKLVQLETEVKRIKKTLLTVETTMSDYQMIATATSKDGIQALLIEDAIPEIEQEANAILSRLTNNQAQIFIESLRDLKKGGTKETLDIKISDPAGIRPYELFSGGEAFRIDFALRIAISKLLARRAGTSLQTLIIDEGFGSQDEEGLSHIMDAIYKIQEDFSKVIIVSHLSSMKDQFPVHFVVEKKPTGSTVLVFQQG